VRGKAVTNTYHSGGVILNMIGLHRVVVLLSLVALAFGGFADEKPKGILKGRIVDNYEHAPISRAYVLVHSYTDNDVRASVDMDGKFSVALPAGYYDVFISAPGFDPACRHFEIESKKTSEYNVALGMAATNSPD
jgi:hypothetical protein